MGEKLTREQHARLAAELAELEGPKRREMVEAISAPLYASYMRNALREPDAFQEL